MTSIDQSIAQRQADFIEELEEKLAELKAAPTPEPSSASAVSEQQEIVQLIVRIPKKLHRELKALCVIRERSIVDVTTDLLANWVEDNKP